MVIQNRTRKKEQNKKEKTQLLPTLPVIELGHKYDIPIYCVVPPANLILEQQPLLDTAAENDQLSFALSNTFLKEDSSIKMDHTQQLVPAPDCSLDPFEICIRLSTEKDISLTISSQNETVGSLRSRLFDSKQLDISNETHILRLIYLGRILQDNMDFVCSDNETDIEKTFMKKGSILIERDSIIQALVIIKP